MLIFIYIYIYKCNIALLYILSINQVFAEDLPSEIRSILKSLAQDIVGAVVFSLGMHTVAYLYLFKVKITV